MRPEQAQYNRIKEASQKLTIKRILFMYTPQSISIIHKYCEKKYDRYSNLNTEKKHLPNNAPKTYSLRRTHRNINNLQSTQTPGLKTSQID
tara:strand:+ start:514 stop:786 length:273 start_codon:yes stop_codon:yes gene_type:complete